MAMESKPPAPPAPPAQEPRLKIYFLPNLLTAGNLFCGFVALTKIVEANLAPDPVTGLVNWWNIKFALACILLACIFDLFDGRVARMGGHESPFGREFDSLADLISFGVAPAFLVHRVVLHRALPDQYAEFGWFIASIYLLCGAFRLARFNCLSAMNLPGAGKDFLGFPIPAAAGLVASLALFIIKLNEKEKDLGRWGYLLPAVNLLRVNRPGDRGLAWVSAAGCAGWIVIAVWFGIGMGNILDPRPLIQSMLALALLGFSLRTALGRAGYSAMKSAGAPA